MAVATHVMKKFINDPADVVKESLAGYWIVDVDEERAIEIASQVVAYTEYPMEVRRIMDHSAQP